MGGSCKTGGVSTEKVSWCRWWKCGHGCKSPHNRRVCGGSDSSSNVMYCLDIRSESCWGSWGPSTFMLEEIFLVEVA